MCSHFLKKMDNYQGDLADIVRATANGGGAAAATWQFPSNTIQYSPDPVDDFGDPFNYMMRDPLMQNDVDSGLFYNSHTGGGEDAGNNSNIFSRMLQISPNAKMVAPPCDLRAAAVAPPRGSILVPSNLQISSPRNTGVKRRKSQSKKVVCIPAPAPANSRATGEIVPSDLWAWRKYGQKPIKGSPYPRGYYRCSSSKGCSARKQVERSRTDPNMLVITYTSEHNHPWPTQRNALAGSTRSQPSKNTKNASPTQEPTNVKEENDQDFDNHFEMEEIEFDEGTYKPPCNLEDSFFADLGEIEGDSLNDVLFTQGFSRVNDTGHDLDPFTFYDWASGTTSATAAYGPGI